jgi:hypothetical protein
VEAAVVIRLELHPVLVALAAAVMADLVLLLWQARQTPEAEVAAEQMPQVV